MLLQEGEPLQEPIRTASLNPAATSNSTRANRRAIAEDRSIVRRTLLKQTQSQKRIAAGSGRVRWENAEAPGRGGGRRQQPCSVGAVVSKVSGPRQSPGLAWLVRHRHLCGIRHWFETLPVGVSRALAVSATGWHCAAGSEYLLQRAPGRHPPGGLWIARLLSTSASDCATAPAARRGHRRRRHPPPWGFRGTASLSLARARRHGPADASTAGGPDTGRFTIPRPAPVSGRRSGRPTKSEARRFDALFDHRRQGQLLHFRRRFPLLGEGHLRSSFASWGGRRDGMPPAGASPP